VGSIAKTTRVRFAKYLAKIIPRSETALVVRVSIVPAFFSSEKERIVIAETRNINIHGARANKGSRFAYPLAGTLVSLNIHVKRPVTNRNTAMVI
jgi:hypothetical protein